MTTTDSPRIGAPIEVYWRPGCGACTSMKLALAEAGVTARFHDIWAEPDAAAYVRSVANGNETVPTVRIGAQVLVAPRPAAALDRLRSIDPALAPTARRWPPLRIVQWVAIVARTTAASTAMAGR